VAAFYGREWSLATIPPEDPAVYEMISAADTVGVFQVVLVLHKLRGYLPRPSAPHPGLLSSEPVPGGLPGDPVIWLGGREY
jgi:hypothetical protein